MSIIAEFTVPADEFALYQTLREVPEMVVEVEHLSEEIAYSRIISNCWDGTGGRIEILGS